MTVQKILLSFKPKNENILPLLHEVNSRFGYISKENAYKIADYFKIAPAKLYEIISTSEILKVEPKSQLEIEVCTGPHCKMKRADDIVKEIEKYFNIKANYFTNKKVKLRTISCPGRCQTGPVVIINENYYENISPEQIDDILRNYI